MGGFGCFCYSYGCFFLVLVLVQFGGDMFQDRVDQMGIVIYVQLVWYGQQQGIGFGNCFIGL